MDIYTIDCCCSVTKDEQSPTSKGTKEHLGVWKYTVLDCVAGFTGEYTCQNLSNCRL